MKHNFSMIPRADIPRSSFDRSHGYKTTFDAGYLVPFFVDEALPGDTFKADLNMFCRLATPIVPFMDNLFLETFFFAVPIRLIWDNWQKFNGEQDNPGDSTDFLVPQITAPEGGWQYGSLADYMGIPTGIAGLKTSALWHRAYNLIWNEWFRDENLQTTQWMHKDDGPDPAEHYILLRRGKRHDYFTSCLPWPQKGPGVELPLGGVAPLSAKTPTSNLWLTDGTTHYGIYGGSAEYAEDYIRSAAFLTKSYGNVGGTITPFINPPDNYTATNNKQAVLGVINSQLANGLQADLSSATATTINSLRQAFQIQKLYERDARGGTRYTEILRAHFGVVSPDARLQRPEYLGGTSGRININPVAQTSASDTTTPQGNLAAFGVYADSKHAFTKSFVEHCVILGLVNVRADLTYQQGLNRMFSRQTRFDFYWPALAHLGEQAVYNKEIYAQGNATDDEVFGYQERWAEYRYKPSLITGKFRSTDPQTLDVWHLSQKFDNLPKLNADFIIDQPPISRVVAVQSEPQFLFDSYMRLKCVRPMPVYSVPGLVDHF